MADDRLAARTVLFVCRHGSAKSVLAAADFRRRANDRGLAIAAISAGTEPDARMSAEVAWLLRDQEPDLAGQVPRAVTVANLTAARRVITFDLDAADLPAAPASIERWDGLPSISANPVVARTAIARRLDVLIDDVVRSRG